MAQTSSETPTGMATGCYKPMGWEPVPNAVYSNMKQLNINRINSISPYEVRIDGLQLTFETVHGLHYEVRFFAEQPIGGCETWQFSFAKANRENAPEDPYVRFTLFAIIDEFFTENDNVLLYICDTTDGRETARNRLFIKWFKQSAQPNRFTIRTASTIVEDQGFYATIIVENRNPLLTDITADFDRTAVVLTSKPGE